jgi:hypothetical protein
LGGNCLNWCTDPDILHAILPTQYLLQKFPPPELPWEDAAPNHLGIDSFPARQEQNFGLKQAGLALKLNQLPLNDQVVLNFVLI